VIDSAFLLDENRTKSPNTHRPVVTSKTFDYAADCRTSMMDINLSPREQGELIPIQKYQLRDHFTLSSVP